MNIALIGYGKMGHIIEEVACERGHKIVCIIDQDNRQDFDSDAFATADVAIEFTTPTTAEVNIRQAWNKGKPVVCGTTGWDIQSVNPAELSNQGRSLVWSSNYSIGVNILFALNKRLAELITPDYTPSIVETHHIHKLDTPSGTAKTLAAQIEAVRGIHPAIESIREGEVPGIHVVTWDSEEDSLILSHSAKSRKGFALGAVLAAEWIVGKTGFHTMQEVLFG